jgi:hypothetical protein
MKSVQAVERQFCARLHDLLKQYWLLPGRIDLNATLREMLEYHIGSAYYEGLMEAGILPEDFDADMAQEADNLIFEQFTHVQGFIDAIQEARGDEAKEAAVEARADLWCQSVRAAGTAGLNRGADTEMVEFQLVGDASEESCDTCIRLLGKRHRRSWVVKHGYEVKPGNDNFECGCYNCPHEWVPIKKGKG